MNPKVILAIFLFAWASQLPAQQDTGSRRLSPAIVGNRVALVIGNKAYPWKPLVNPENDARAVAAALKDAGFAGRDIHLVIDALQIDLRREVRQFVESVKPGDLAFIYYSGHGVEVKGNNYLLPVDLPRDATEGYVQDEAVSAQRLLRDLNDQGAAVRVLVLDACRDNPLRATKSFAGGLAPMESSGSLVVFSTEAGRTADDNPGGTNGLFTQYLLEGLRERGVSLDEAMKHVSRKVARATGQRQIPALYGLLMEDLVLIPGNPQNSPQQAGDSAQGPPASRDLPARPYQIPPEYRNNPISEPSTSGLNVKDRVGLPPVSPGKHTKVRGIVGSQYDQEHLFSLRVDAGSMITVTSDEKTKFLHVKGATNRPTAGAEVEVQGTLNANGEIAAKKIITYKQKNNHKE